jgi:hypothetical protein
MKSAYVFGGYNAQMKGSWAKALRYNCGIEVAHACCADDDFRGAPTDNLPKGVDLVLVVVGSCSHSVSERAKSLAWRAGIRCETVSKDIARSVNWLRARGYVYENANKDEAPQAVPAANGKGVLVVDDVGNVEPLVSEPEWLDRSQVKQLLPDLTDQQFYNTVKVVVTREPRKDRRLMPTTDFRTGNVRHHMREVQVWTLEEVMAVEAMAKAQGVIADKPRVTQEAKPRALEIPTDVPDGVPVPMVEVAKPHKATTQYAQAVALDPLGALPTVNLDWLIRSLCNVAEELADAAVLERNEWKGKYDRVQAENVALKAQLERIKSAHATLETAMQEVK